MLQKGPPRASSQHLLHPAWPPNPEVIKPVFIACSFQGHFQQVGCAKCHSGEAPFEDLGLRAQAVQRSAKEGSKQALTSRRLCDPPPAQNAAQAALAPRGQCWEVA